MTHEAVAVVPRTGIVYLTEDATPSGFYRYLPTKQGKLIAGGELQMLMIETPDGSSYFLSLVSSPLLRVGPPR